MYQKTTKNDTNFFKKMILLWTVSSEIRRWQLLKLSKIYQKPHFSGAHLCRKIIQLSWRCNMFYLLLTPEPGFSLFESVILKLRGKICSKIVQNWKKLTKCLFIGSIDVRLQTSDFKTYSVHWKTPLSIKARPYLVDVKGHCWKTTKNVLEKRKRWFDYD